MKKISLNIVQLNMEELMKAIVSKDTDKIISLIVPVQKTTEEIKIISVVSSYINHLMDSNNHHLRNLACIFYKDGFEEEYQSVCKKISESFSHDFQSDDNNSD